MNEPGIYAHLVDDDARDVLVLDSSTFIKEIGLTSQKDSALKHYLYRRRCASARGRSGGQGGSSWKRT